MSIQTKDTYRAFSAAFDHFNVQLFDDTLPGCIITMQQKRGTAAYYRPASWRQRKGQNKIDEIGFNPDLFKERKTEIILSSLVHEMVHMWQYHFGSPSRNGYHNAEWAQRMTTCGLIPSHNGEQGGKQTGQLMMHYIDPNGDFLHQCRRLATTGYKIPWQTLGAGEGAGEPATKSRNRTKYQCSNCKTAVWGKPSIEITCTRCGKAFRSC